MYGHIHVVIKDLVMSAFGAEAWEKVLAEAALDETEHFLQFDYCDDSTTVKLIMAASKCLELPLSDVLEAFGDFFLKHCLRHGYDNMLRTLGRDMKSFIQNLDSLHSLLLLSYDKLVAPSFRCESGENGTLTLHYYSCREGLGDIVKGVLRAVGTEIFHQKVRLELVSKERNDLGGGRSQEHCVFTVYIQDEEGREPPEGGEDKQEHEEKMDGNKNQVKWKGKLVMFRGQMRWMEEEKQMMFIGSPLIKSLKEMKEMDVYMADIPLFDVTREIVLLYEQRNAEIDITRQLDLTTAELKRTSKALERERRKTEELLHEMLPPKVAKTLINGGKVEAENFERVTIMFSDVVTFTNIAAACPPEKIVDMLNDMYERFDKATTRWDVYKVETIGDAYMVVSGAPERSTDHPYRVARFAMDIIGEAAQVPSPATGKPLQIRVGIHTGPVMAGVVGIKMPRYCLFGDTVNTASRMESHGIPGRIHLSPDAYHYLRNQGFSFKRRGEMEVKGKGRMVTHFLVGHLEHQVKEPADAFTDFPILTDADLENEDPNLLGADLENEHPFLTGTDLKREEAVPTDNKKDTKKGELDLKHLADGQINGSSEQENGTQERERGDGDSAERKESTQTAGGGRIQESARKSSQQTETHSGEPPKPETGTGNTDSTTSSAQRASLEHTTRVVKPDYSFLFSTSASVDAGGAVHDSVTTLEEATVGRKCSSSKMCSVL